MDLVAGPIDVTITAVKVLKGEQPVHIEMAGEEYKGRPYKPSKTMRRLLGTLWGTDGNAWLGRRLRLWRNPEITWGNEKVGGIEIAAMSDIDGQHTLTLPTGRNKRRQFTVDLLEAGEKPPYPSEDFESNFPKWAQAVAADKATPQNILARVTSKGTLTDEQRDRILQLGSANAPADELLS